MQDYFFGTMDEFVETGYAPTSRAMCRGCRAKIEKGEVRIGDCIESDHFNSRLWYHLPCFELKPLFKGIDPKRQIYKLDQLEEEDQETVVEHVSREVERLQGRKRGKANSAKKAKSQAKNQKQKAKKQEVEEKEAETSNRRTTRSRSRPKSKPKSKKELSPQPLPSSPPKKPRKKRAATSATKSSARKAKPKKKKAPSEQAYTPEQKEKLKELIEKYMQLNVDRLKSILTANNQTKKGTKAELAEKCADGELLGRIPQCTHCGGGKLRFLWRASLYQCPGFMDDQEFKNCNRYFTFKQIVREPWVQPT